MEYNGIKVMWRILLLECTCLIASSFLDAWLTDVLGLSMYPSMMIAQLHMLIPIIIGGIYLMKSYRYYTFSNMIGLCGFDPVILLPIIFMPYASESFGTWMIWPYIQTLTDIFGAQTDAINAPESVSELLFMIALLCIIVPVIEETLFRGILYKIIEPYGTLAAVFITAFAFAALHFSVPAFIVIFVVGSVMGFIRVCSGSIFPCMIFHALFNLSSVVQLVFESEMSGFEAPIAVLSIIAAAVLPILIFLIYRVWGRGKFHCGVISDIKGGTVSLIIIIAIYAFMAISSAVMNNPDGINIDFGSDLLEEVYDLDF